MPLVQILTYLALAIAFIAMFAKAMRYFTAPATPALGIVSGSA